MNLLNESSQSRKVNGISAEETLRIKDFLQGAVYCWCKNNKGEWFSLRDLMGGDNYDCKELHYSQFIPNMKLIKTTL